MAMRIIQIIIAPVVMVSTCAILTGGMLSHYGAISDRLRALARERLELLRKPDGGITSVDGTLSDYIRERLREIDAQTPHLVRRHTLVHNGILATYLAILCFIVSMFVIALAAVTEAPVAASLAVFVFLGSTAVLLAGIIQIAHDIRMSRLAVQYEAKRVLMLGKQEAPSGGVLLETSHLAQH
jgi:hypothetical protein